MSQNQLSVSVQETLASAFSKNLFKDVDFSGLNSAIEAIGNHSKQLSDSEKKMAVEIIDNWNNNVVTKLYQRNQELTTMVQFFAIPASGCYSIGLHDDLLDVGYDIATHTNTLDTFQQYQDAREKYNEEAVNQPIKPVIDETQAYAVQLVENKDYELEVTRHRLRLQKLERNVFLKDRAWKQELSKNPEIMALVKHAKTYSRNVGSLQSECQEKAELAKLNISIGSEEVREQLKSLLEFAKTIK